MKMCSLAPAVALSASRRRSLRLVHAHSTRYLAACWSARRGACTATPATSTTPWTPEVDHDTTANNSSSTSAQTSASASSAAAPLARHFVYAPCLRYTAPWRSKRLTDFLSCHDDVVTAIAHTYRHPVHNITVTLIPLRHFAHPDFFRQVDDLCAQHESVLMEGRTPLRGAPYSTIVPPRPRVPPPRPPEHDDDEGWEPREVEKFFQPFSWGVEDSPYHTVVHAADRYDYERLPWWCSVRFNAPVVGSVRREQHCLNMIYPLNDNLYKTFAIPWGAAHMPVFHEMLLDNGFENVGMCSLVVLQRIDGIISEGEFGKMQRWQRARARRISYVYCVGVLCLFSFLHSYVSVDYRRGPSEE
ncbi:putative mitochondrial hypothetical protein [Leptomonas pyrrhocoris]|uniref:Uncharacterized protein n=1 Tax=Leptomonas pyrrhocoris TaxID=157538 RepID=A0A0M9FYN0_LEPPY|nr:putative mitochondrial hypothetical protein [Leptomonas pyrrhocoris]KPA78637.1 putative mitochondrial hypothetical protein [Leptomonas pyrrhocoris]|eukprot:XP_015657076.1 putative mitochondrial hypothetical protein [Leptomonas pyrrhocoris]